MRTSLYRLSGNDLVFSHALQPADEHAADLVLCFGARDTMVREDIYSLVRGKFPAAQISFCSTAGEIIQEEVTEGELVVVAMQFEKTRVEARSVNVKEFQNTYTAALYLSRKLPPDELKYVLVFSDGSLVNGSELVKGLTLNIDRNILITGGLAGNGSEFHSTLVSVNKQPVEGEIVALGFYGDHIRVTHGSQGGWDVFGLEKRVTNSSANVLLELEDQNALDLYKKYLGDEARNLPASALLFPLSVVIPGARKPVVRTILSVNEDEQSMTFAGDVPVGSTVRFMRANFAKLTQAAAEAATRTMIGNSQKPAFSLLISCVGRKLILGKMTDQEVKAVGRLFDHKTVMAGFYSYGEISPFNEGGKCQLHNQTMTITSFYEY